MSTSTNSKTAVWRAVAPVVAGIVLAVLPVPSGLKTSAWLYFSLFVAVIVGLVLEPLPAAATGLIGVAVAALAGLVEPKPADSVKWALAGFSNGTVWLIFGAFMFALGYEKSGLGKRMALRLVKALGRRTLGLGYAVTFSDLVLAPFTPSNTARSGGTVFPVIRNIPGLYGSEPGTASTRKSVRT